MPVDALRGLVDQPHRKLQLPGGVSSVGQRSAHERPGALLAEHNLAEDGLVQLHEVAALVAQGDDFVPEDSDDVGCQVFRVWVGAV